MPAASLSLRGPPNTAVGTITISGLPTAASPEDRSLDAARPRSEPAIQLREASSYRYKIDIAGLQRVRCEPAELFDPDDESGMSGRLHTREYVGAVRLTAFNDQGGDLGSVVVLIRASKLEHEHEYSRMLKDIADAATEAVLQGFAPASMASTINASKPPRLLYQQFAILQARLEDQELIDAIAEVVHRTQRDWVSEVERRPPGRPLRANSAVARSLTGPGRRVPAANLIGLLKTLPATIESTRSTDTFDTVANRFVKFALTHWRDLAAQLEGILATKGAAAYAVRGMATVARVAETLDDVLSEPLFREIGPLKELPTSNQVLLKREGYRQIFSTFALIESSLDLRVELEDAIHPSQRNIATLYEYWTFLKLVEVIGAACGDRYAPLRLFERDGDGLSLGLRRGQQSQLRWQVLVAGRLLAVSVYFNRTFRTANDHRNDGSWSQAMVPDASVLIHPIGGRERVDNQRDLDVWLHFDAKYKVDWASTPFERPAPEQEDETALTDEEQERLGTSRREDLLKMHAYRDAIRRSAGAYVLFPGISHPLHFREYVELIPGLGAFPLRPGDGKGPAAVRRFIDDVLLHAADQATAEERSRYWRAQIFEGPAGSDRSPVDFLNRPPADTPVLISQTKDAHHWQWIETTSQYVVKLGLENKGLTFRAEELASPSDPAAWRQPGRFSRDMAPGESSTKESWQLWLTRHRLTVSRCSATFQESQSSQHG